METEKKTITIKQGLGDEAIEMTVQVTQEELDAMEQIKRYSPKNWEGKELDLLQEARKVIKEKPKEEISDTQVEMAEREADTIDENAKPNNKGLWWTLGVLVVLLIGYLIINSVIKQKADEAREVIVRSAMSNTTKTFTYQSISFDYPGNWTFAGNKQAEGVYMIGGQNEKDSEYGIFLLTNTDQAITKYIDDIITGYATSRRFSEVEYSSIYDTYYNKNKALAADYSYVSQGEHYYGKLFGFTVNGKTVIINPVAHSEKALAGDDFKIMENTLKFQ